jgi:alkylated DNA repair dioxygenase AlkB
MNKTKSTTLLIDPVDLSPGEIRRIPLTKEGNSWVEIEMAPEEIIDYGAKNFNKLFNLHPLEQGKIIMYEQELLSYRWHQSYLRTPQRDPAFPHSYMFSGYDESSINQELPSEFQVFYDFMLKRDARFNQIVANWYLDGNDYIAQHSDCELGMIPDAIVSMINFNRLNARENCRVFKIQPKPTDVDVAEFQAVSIVLRNGVMITMGGDTQKQFKHGVPKMSLSEGEAAPRFSLSFRQFAGVGGQGQSCRQLSDYRHSLHRQPATGDSSSAGDEEQKGNELRFLQPV